MAKIVIQVIDETYEIDESQKDQLVSFLSFLAYQESTLYKNYQSYLKKIIETKGYDLSQLADKIKSTPFERSGFDYVLGKHLINWIAIELNCNLREAKDIIDLLVKVGFLKDSGLGNYK